MIASTGFFARSRIDPILDALDESARHMAGYAARRDSRTRPGSEEARSGDAARRLGEEGLFQHLALQNIETLRRHEATLAVRRVKKGIASDTPDHGRRTARPSPATA